MLKWPTKGLDASFHQLVHCGRLLRQHRLHRQPPICLSPRFPVSGLTLAPLAEHKTRMMRKDQRRAKEKKLCKEGESEVSGVTITACLCGRLFCMLLLAELDDQWLFTLGAGVLAFSVNFNWYIFLSVSSPCSRNGLISTQQIQGVSEHWNSFYSKKHNLISPAFSGG